MPKSDYTNFRALDPFFAIVMEGLSKFVDGEHYFDVLDDNVLFEFRYHFPGYPKVVRGRTNLPPYDNRFVSIATIEKRKIVRWRDYMDSLAAWTALSQPTT